MVAEEKEKGNKKTKPTDKAKKVKVDVTEDLRRFNSKEFASPPNRFNAGHVKPRKLDAKAFSKTKGGYQVQFPSKAPIPTPAVYKGKIYVGGGFQSREFYCLKADTGELIWGFDLDDDGPSAPAVEDDVVIYNTESCTIFAHDANTGKLLWSYWLGDPLMSSPTIASGRVFAAYPAAGRTAGSDPVGIVQFGNAENPNQNQQKADEPPPQIQTTNPPSPVPAQNKPKPANKKKNAKAAPPLSHVLTCFELKTGKIIWQRWIDSDVMSAPVASSKELHIATFAGTLVKFNQADGKILSAKKQRATSAPVAWGDELVYSKRTDKAGEDAVLSEH